MPFKAIADRLSDGAKDMLLHIARVRPLPKPFPSHEDGLSHLNELQREGMITRVTDKLFSPTWSGLNVASIVNVSATAIDESGSAQ